MVDNRPKNECSGCTACANICPVKAITMAEDEEGFKYPVVDKKKCIGCGLCKKKCPIINEMKKFNLKESYIVQNKDERILDYSTSGGAFYGIAKFILDNSGIVCAPILDDNLKVKHVFINNTIELKKALGSKYVQSDLDNIFCDIEKLLKNGKRVLFSGTPCQIEGLKAFLKKEYTNLIAVGIVCHGVPSPKVWEKYLKEQEQKYNKKIIGVNFRDKTFGYNRSGMKLMFADGSVKVQTPPDQFLDAFFSEIISRPSCYHCKFKKIERNSDLVLFDSWNAAKSNDNITNRGATNVFVYSNTGKEIVNALTDNYNIVKSDYKKAVSEDGIMILNNAKENKNRKLFFHDLEKKSLKELKRKYYNFSFKKKILFIIKDLLNRLNILEKIYGVKK